MSAAVVGAYALLVLGAVAGMLFGSMRSINIRLFHNSLAGCMVLIIGLGLVKHTKKLMVNASETIAWFHFGIFALMTMLATWMLVAHNRPPRRRQQQKKAQRQPPAEKNSGGGEKSHDHH